MKFGLHFLVMDPGYHPANRKLIEENAALMEIPIEIFESDIFDVVVDVDESPCYLCARMRRGFLYAHAKELGCNKIALGHHFDDVIETVLMSMLYGGQVNTMMPKLHSTNFEGMELLRPLYFVKERAIIDCIFCSVPAGSRKPSQRNGPCEPKVPRQTGWPAAISFTPRSVRR